MASDKKKPPENLQEKVILENWSLFFRAIW